MAGPNMKVAHVLSFRVILNFNIPGGGGIAPGGAHQYRGQGKAVAASFCKGDLGAFSLSPPVLEAEIPIVEE